MNIVDSPLSIFLKKKLNLRGQTEFHSKYGRGKSRRLVSLRLELELHFDKRFLRRGTLILVHFSLV